VADLANRGRDEQERHKAERALMSANYLLVRFIFERHRLDQAPDARPTTIFDGGRIRQYSLANELLTESELLMVAAAAKVFSSIKEILLANSENESFGS
jgi:hypothetical protein